MNKDTLCNQTKVSAAAQESNTQSKTDAFIDDETSATQHLPFWQRPWFKLVTVGGLVSIILGFGIFGMHDEAFEKAQIPQEETSTQSTPSIPDMEKMQLNLADVQVTSKKQMRVDEEVSAVIVPSDTQEMDILPAQIPTRPPLRKPAHAQVIEPEVEMARYQASSSLYEYQDNNSSNPTLAVKAKRMQHPETTVASGEVISAVLESAIDSQLVGPVKAVVAQDVYGHIGQRILIPKGSRLLGRYQSASSPVQSRVFIEWTRVILPNGVSANLHMPSTDRLGRTGQRANHIETHLAARVGQAVLISLLNAGSQALSQPDENQTSVVVNMGQEAGQSLTNTAGSALEELMDVAPTLQVFQGTPIRVLVTEDIDFHSVIES